MLPKTAHNYDILLALAMSFDDINREEYSR